MKAVFLLFSFHFISLLYSFFISPINSASPIETVHYICPIHHLSFGSCVLYLSDITLFSCSCVNIHLLQPEVDCFAYDCGCRQGRP